MNKISDFIKRTKISTIATYLLIATLFLAMIAGVAMSFHTTTTTTTPEHLALVGTDQGIAVSTLSVEQAQTLGLTFANGAFALPAGKFVGKVAATTSVSGLGLTHTAYGLTTLILTSVVIVALIAYLITKNFLPAIKQWRETDAGTVTMTSIYVVTFITILALMSVALALH